jgi:hypothetical protein
MVEPGAKALMMLKNKLVPGPSLSSQIRPLWSVSPTTMSDVSPCRPGLALRRGLLSSLAACRLRVFRVARRTDDDHVALAKERQEGVPGVGLILPFY